ncbi:Cof-type HAD-IIB family hydrolase [Paenibacillus sp. SC116]|uniref:Cof-type HAD-IIB family hydrolase n=1 Tax=Paenibacillus sp. SC116 TaxID=2968986 RepID=UPI00215A4949|nr:Cof-type HAD-IIB family hydrolase [Paenibacillus sp. SC116]MCR8844526.1 Cof-type HAD-IIB family hydrolase [Paenibacillus sp. SC116]
MKYKMIVLDLDDTLLRDDGTISAGNKQALMTAQEAGVKVVLASGRPTYAMRALADELHLERYGSYILSFNGAKIINWKTQEESFSSTLKPEMAHALHGMSLEEGVSALTYVGDDIITEAATEYTHIESQITGMKVVEVPSFAEAVQVPVVKVLMVAEPEKLVLVEEKLKAKMAGQLNVMRSKPFFLEFTEDGVNKGTSLNHLIQQLGIERSEVIAMGDGYNDVAMLEFAGLAVAMGNAPDEIKQIADYVTDTNMNDGVAKAVEHFVLKDLVPTT